MIDTIPYIISTIAVLLLVYVLADAFINHDFFDNGDDDPDDWRSSL